MLNESQKILNTFSHKLSNCRGTVLTQKLIDLLDEGKYGYSCEKGVPTVITNDYVFADDMEKLVAHLYAIFKSPRITLKKDNIVQNSAIASKSDTESLLETMEDAKNWRITKDGPKPEFVHTYVFEENYAIYENRFICALIDLVYDVICKKINQLTEEFDTLNGKIKGSDELFITTPEFLDFAHLDENAPTPTLVSASAPLVRALGSLIKSKKRLMSLKTRDLYIICKKTGRFPLEAVKLTNVFTYDNNYFYCYNFYMKYLRREPVFSTPQQRYFNFVTINLFRAITRCGFDIIDKDVSSVTITKPAVLAFDSIDFGNEFFTLSVKPTDDGNLVIVVHCNSDTNESSYLVRVLDTESALAIDGFLSADEYAVALNEEKAEDIMRVMLVTDYSKVEEDNAFYIEPYYADVDELLQKLVKACVMTFEGSFYVHSRVCPVCGSSLVAPDGSDYMCANCESIYHMFNFGPKELMWLKLLRRQDKQPDILDDSAFEVLKEETEPKQDTTVNLKIRVACKKKGMRKNKPTFIIKKSSK